MKQQWWKIKDIAQYYGDTNTTLIRKNLENPAFKDSWKRVGETAIRVNLEKYDEILNKYYN